MQVSGYDVAIAPAAGGNESFTFPYSKIWLAIHLSRVTSVNLLKVNNHTTRSNLDAHLGLSIPKHLLGELQRFRGAVATVTSTRFWFGTCRPVTRLTASWSDRTFDPP